MGSSERILNFLFIFQLVNTFKIKIHKIESKAVWFGSCLQAVTCVACAVGVVRAVYMMYVVYAVHVVHVMHVVHAVYARRVRGPCGVCGLPQQGVTPRASSLV